MENKKDDQDELKIEFYNSILAKADKEDKRDAIALYFQQLWQIDNLIVLIGAGFSKSVKGPLMADLSRKALPPVVLLGILKEAKSEDALKSWVSLWGLPNIITQAIIKEGERSSVEDFPQLAEHCSKLNIETKIGELQAILVAFKALGRDAGLYESGLTEIKKSIVSQISSISHSFGDEEFTEFRQRLQPYRSFFRRLLTYRRPQQPRIKVFTCNYDTLIEAACDLEGIHCVTGFDGKALRTLNPSIFDVDLTFRGTGQASVYYANVIHLYKLHGSIDWRILNVDGIDEIVQGEATGSEVLIYPCSTKFAETLEAPYHEMFRRLGESTSQPQSVLLSVGYGFNDDHINQMIMRAYKNPSCQLLLCEPRAAETSSEFLRRMIKMATPEGENTISDPRVTVIAGSDAKFPNILNVLFQPLEIESPSEQIKKLLQKLVQIGQGSR